MSTTFLVIALALVVMAILFAVLPLLRAKSSLALILLLLVVIPTGSWFGYQMIGTPAALNPENLVQQPAVNNPQSMADAIAMLKVRLAENPEDLEGWLLLGRSLLATEHPEQAVTAYRAALTLDPASAYIKMELGNAILSNSQPPEFPSEAKSLIQAAFTADPGLQKAQWLLGIAEASGGNYQLALDLWRDLLSKLEPGSNIAVTVSQQIAEVESRLGIQSASINIRIELSAAVTTAITDESVLFVFLQIPEQAGMPLAVKRIPAPQLPMDISITDESILQAGKSLLDFPELLLSAKLSSTGTADTNTDDLVVPAIRIKPSNIAPITLLLQSSNNE